jgi:hypothetical protein
MFWCKWYEHLSRCLGWGYSLNLKLACSFLDGDPLHGTQNSFGRLDSFQLAYGGMPKGFLIQYHIFFQIFQSAIYSLLN